MYTENFTGELSFAGAETGFFGVVFSCLCYEVFPSRTSKTDSSLFFTPAAAPAAFCTQQAEIVDPQEKRFFVESVIHTGPTLSYFGFDTAPLQWRIAEDMAYLCFVSVRSGRAEAPAAEKKRRYRRYSSFFSMASPGQFQRVLRL